MSTESEFEPDPEIIEADDASGWVAWYFKQGALTLVTAPLFLILVAGVASEAYGAIIHALALVRASYAVFGFFGAFISVSFGWIPVILPPVCYYSLVSSLPGTWRDRDSTRRAKIWTTITVIILLPLAASLIDYGVSWSIGRIADHNPCAALSAGVTGSKPVGKCS